MNVAENGSYLIDLALRRMMLAAAAAPGEAQGLLDCASMAFVAGRRDVARLLFETVFILRGYDAAERAFQHDVQQETGLWTIEAQDVAPIRDAGGARAEAPAHRQVMIEAARMLREIAPASERARPAVAASLRDPRLARDKISALRNAGQLPDAIAALHAALSSPHADTGLGDALDAIVGDPIVAGSTQAREHVDAPTATLALLLAGAALRQFLLDRWPLICETHGAPELLHSAARSEPVTGGPYLRSIATLVRDPAELIAVAREANGNREGGGFGQTLAQLSSALSPHQRYDLIDAAADTGSPSLLQALADGLIRNHPADDADLLRRLRDAAIDLGEPAFAAEHQHRLTTMDASSAIEWSILGDLHVSAGAMREAAEAYREAARLAEDPARSDAFVAERIRRVQAQPVLIGYNSSPGRQARRRRAAAAITARLWDDGGAAAPSTTAA